MNQVGEYYSDFQKSYNSSIDSNQSKSVSQPFVYPPIGNLIPMQLPMLAMRPNIEIEYNRWLASQYSYRNPYYEAENQYFTQNNPRISNHSDTSKLKHFDNLQNCMFEQQQQQQQQQQQIPGYYNQMLPESPKFGPGPPIVTSERVKGPRGCNLFIFHLPNEITNWDLFLLFRKNGTILSVHTMINKTTGLSKSYGFISFAKQEEAKIAIEEMDGFRLGKKRLKVQLKRSQDDISGEEDDLLYHNSSFDQSGSTTRASTPGNTRTNSNTSIDSLTNNLDTMALIHLQLADSIATSSTSTVLPLHNNISPTTIASTTAASKAAISPDKKKQLMIDYNNKGGGGNNAATTTATTTTTATSKQRLYMKGKCFTPDMKQHNSCNTSPSSD